MSDRLGSLLAVREATTGLRVELEPLFQLSSAVLGLALRRQGERDSQRRQRGPGQHPNDAPLTKPKRTRRPFTGRRSHINYADEPLATHDFRRCGAGIA